MITRQHLRDLIREDDTAADPETCDPGGCEVEIASFTPEEIQRMREELAALIKAEIDYGTPEKDALDMMGWSDSNENLKGAIWSDYLPAGSKYKGPAQKNEGARTMRITREQLSELIREALLQEESASVMDKPVSTQELKRFIDKTRWDIWTIEHRVFDPDEYAGDELRLKEPYSNPDIYKYGEKSIEAILKREKEVYDAGNTSNMKAPMRLEILEFVMEHLK